LAQIITFSYVSISSAGNPVYFVDIFEKYRTMPRQRYIRWLETVKCKTDRPRGLGGFVNLGHGRSKPDLENDPSIPDHRFPSIGEGAEPSESGTLDERLWYGVQESLALVRWTIGEYWDVVELIGLA